MKKIVILALIAAAAYGIYTNSQKSGAAKTDKSENAAEAKKEEHNYKEISADELKAMMEKDADLFIIDSRSPEYMADGTIIKGAVVKTTDDLTKEFLSERANTPETPIVFYCSNTKCPASMQSANKASGFGFKNVLKFPGGIDEWKEKGYPTEKVEVKEVVKEAVKDAAEKVEGAAKEVSKTTEEAVKSVGDAVKDVKDAVKKAADKQ